MIIRKHELTDLIENAIVGHGKRDKCEHDQLSHQHGDRRPASVEWPRNKRTRLNTAIRGMASAPFHGKQLGVLIYSSQEGITFRGGIVPLRPRTGKETGQGKRKGVL